MMASHGDGKWDGDGDVMMVKVLVRMIYSGPRIFVKHSGGPFLGLERHGELLFITIIEPRINGISVMAMEMVMEMATVLHAILIKVRRIKVCRKRGQVIGCRVIHRPVIYTKKNIMI